MSFISSMKRVFWFVWCEGIGLDWWSSLQLYLGDDVFYKEARRAEADEVGRKVFVSFGGLLLYMEGPYKNLTQLRIDYVYLCIKK